MADAQVVSAHEFLRQQGSSCIVLHPTLRLLFLGYGCDEIPRAVPHCIAHHEGNLANGGTVTPATAGSWGPDVTAYHALTEVHKVLHLQAPPEPPGLRSEQQRPNSSSPPPASPSGDLFPFAKAGLVNSRELGASADNFTWFKTRKAATTAARTAQPQQLQQPRGMVPVHATGAQLQQPSNGQAEGTTSYVPCVVGTQVTALWPGEPYKTHWLMTPDGHLADFETTPEHELLDRFERVWGWAVQAELGVAANQLSQLSAVLMVSHTMTAAEVRFLADVLLERLGCASLVVHLDSVAATFGNGATSACVVQMDSSITNVVCVDDAVVLQPASSRRQVSVGLNDVAAALIGWMACYRHWPSEIEAAGLGVGCCLGITAGVYGVLMLQELVMQQCYCPKESLTLGLVGRAMLEDQPAAVLPIRKLGTPTVNYQISLGSWAAVAAMVYFYPDLAPTLQQLTPAATHLQEEQQQQPIRHADRVDGGTSAHGTSHSNGIAEAAQAEVVESVSGLDVDYKGRLYQQYHATVHDTPAAESMYLQGQLKARLEAGETGPPPVGLYLPPLDMPGPSKGDPDDPENLLEPVTRAASGSGPGPAAPANTAAGADAATDAAGAAAVERIPLDEAIFKSIVTAAAGRTDVFERLCNGILLIGPGASLRGLGPMLERRLMQRFSSAGRQQVVNVLELRGHPSHIAWKGGALLAALDAGRENWLPRHQWVQGGMVLRPPKIPKAAKEAKLGQNAAGTPGTGGGAGNLSAAAAGRHAKLCYYIKAEQGRRD